MCGRALLLDRSFELYKYETAPPLLLLY